MSSLIANDSGIVDGHFHFRSILFMFLVNKKVLDFFVSHVS